ncbi:MAG: class I SAM-dependent methyltransferase [Planctomycetes bacterium]|nr:class I SAM-dependent methyltransferase [Planctomycetota bacterium]
MSRVACADPGLAAALGLPHGQADLVLEYIDGALHLRDTRPGAPGPICADFESQAAENRRKAGRGLLLAKAIGVKPGQQLSVLDATAGLGRDSYALAALNCVVTAVERSPVVAALLRDALYRSSQDPAAARISLLLADAREQMQTARYDVVYLDPMFPDRRKSAKVKKEMQYMQDLLGHEDGNDLLEPALQAATRRVVVKRPVHAPPLPSAAKPTHVHKGKSVRFDVYMS